jgi:hypothetical protein
VTRGSLEQAAAVLAAGVFLLLGVLGLVPGVTSHHDELRFAGGGSHAELFGLFRVSILLDLVHLALGAVGLSLARTPEGARAFLTGGAVASLGLWLLGAVAAGSWLPVDRPDNWLHFALGCAMLGVAAAVDRVRPAAV